MKPILSIFTLFLSLAAYANPNPADPTQGYCQTVDPGACGWGGGSQQQAPKRVINIPSLYGAVAIDNKIGVAGVSEDQKSRRAAKKQAIQACEKRGGVNCKVMGVSKNSCIGYSFSETGKSTYYVAVSGGRSIDEVNRKSMEGCRAGGGKKCEVMYAHCNKDPRYDMY